jgi:hypothetical protein
MSRKEPEVRLTAPGVAGIIVDDFNNVPAQEKPMATVNFSVPDEVKREFQETFAGENRSAIIARLMREAVAERRRQERRSAAIDALLEMRERLPAVSAREVERARKIGRP